MTFTLPIVPPKTTSQMKRVSFKARRFFKSDALESAEADYLSLLRPHRPPQPLEGALEVGIVFVWPHLAGASQKRRVALEPKTTRPDLDNSGKALIDCLVKLQFLYDDGQVARLTLEKFHGPTPGVTVRLEPFQEAR